MAENMSVSRKLPLPVLVLTGFLGSGKTTLLNRLLHEGPRAAVLINEFGSTPVDQQLIERQEIPLMTLSGGCLCCRVRGAFAPVLKNLWMAWSRSATPPFERVIIETSGVASPEPILDTLLRDRWLATRYRLHTVVTTLAIPSALEQLDRFPEARAQVAWADALVLTQPDLAGAEDRLLLDARLHEFAPAKPRFSSLRGELDVDALLQPPTHGAGDRLQPLGADLPDHGFRSLSLYLDEPLPWSTLQSALETLLLQHRERLMRIKGVVYLPDRVEPVVVQAGSGRLYPPAPLPLRSLDDRRGRLVFIALGPAEELGRELMLALGGTGDPGSVRTH
ncbi:MAG: GTP-binding protein [Pseudomonadota bacterium]|jgi:G3E family GTPase